MPLLSVAIVTHNEEQNIARTLASVAWAGEIIVVDSHSTDRTVEIARSFGAQVIQRDWPGFAAQKNFAIAQCTGEWVLSLDADEELSAELQHEMQDLLKSGHDVDAYYLKRRNLFLGRWMRHGGFYPDAKLRLFRRNAADPDRTPRFIDRAVHEVIAFDGPTAMLAGDLIHHAYPTLSDYIAHMDRYSTLGAQVLLDSSRNNQALPAFVARIWLVPWLGFIGNYFFRLGFLDGREGLVLHLYHATYASWKQAKAWEKAGKSRATTGSSRE
jgi:glycosyltransferase involved in cell wall biosynthesis